MRIRSLVHSPLVALAASFVLWRLAHLFFLHPIFYFWSGEEPSRGTIALDMLHRLPYPWIAYRADEYSGGSIVVGAITAIFFRLFGPTAFALKLTPVLLFTLTLILWYRLIERETDAPTAVAFGLLFTFAPPLLMRYTLTNMGFHSESCFFTALTLWLLFDLHRSGDRPAWEFVALGFVAGFGLWFTYIFALTLAAGSVLWVVRFRRDWSRKDLTLLAGGFVLGFYPWIKANVFGPVNGCFIGEQAVWDHFGFSEFTHSLFCLKTSFPYRWASSFATEDWRLVGFGRPNTVYAILAALLILAWAAGRARGRIFRRPSDLSLLALIYLGIFTLAMQASDFKSPHYRVAAMPFLIFLAASAIREFQQSASMRRRRLAAVALTAFVGAG
ncbi:MAG TPA: glycosyltransferase family 39 protein, partial [Elusimicrobiota bacterium]|nr:glycosyltransferase family 39 protein [Elusimicrobiota bacterium]